MKTKLKVDVSVPGMGIGRRGQVLEVPDDKAKELIKAGHAEEASAATAAEEIPAELAVKKRPKPGADRETKTSGPAETKGQEPPAGVITAATLNAPAKPEEVLPPGGTPVAKPDAK